MEALLAPDVLGKIIQTIGAIIVAIITKWGVDKLRGSKGKAVDEGPPADEGERKPIPPSYPGWIVAGVVAALIFGLLGWTYDALTPEPTCELNNLLTCRDGEVPITTDSSRLEVTTTSTQTVVFNFDNDKSYSGIAFQFRPALKVRGFTHLEIRGTATEDFKFVVEYKVRKEPQVESEYKLFPAGTTQTIRVPMEYDERVEEIALMFYNKGQASEVTIESIRLSK